jgi:hypothetical protein
LLLYCLVVPSLTALLRRLEDSFSVVLLRFAELESNALLLQSLFHQKRVPKAPDLSMEDTVLN